MVRVSALSELTLADIDSIRLLSPDAAQEEGRSVATPAHGAPWSRRYTVVYVKQHDQWLIASVRETGSGAESVGTARRTRAGPRESCTSRR